MNEDRICWHCGGGYNYMLIKIQHGVVIANHHCGRRCYLIREKGMGICVYCDQDYPYEARVEELGEDIGSLFCSDYCASAYGHRKYKDSGFYH